MLTSLPWYYTCANDETEHVLPACQTAYSCVQSSAGQVGDGVEPSCEEQQVSRVSQKKEDTEIPEGREAAVILLLLHFVPSSR